MAEAVIRDEKLFLVCLALTRSLTDCPGRNYVSIQGNCRVAPGSLVWLQIHIATSATISPSETRIHGEDKFADGDVDF